MVKHLSSVIDLSTLMEWGEASFSVTVSVTTTLEHVIAVSNFGSSTLALLSWIGDRDTSQLFNSFSSLRFLPRHYRGPIVQTENGHETISAHVQSAPCCDHVMADLFVEDGEIRVNKTSVTNYSLEIVCAVNGPRNSGIASGHVYKITTTYGDVG